jgi:hypothetical protein
MITKRGETKFGFFIFLKKFFKIIFVIGGIVIPLHSLLKREVLLHLKSIVR